MTFVDPRPGGPAEAVDTSLGRRFFNVRTLLSFVVGFGVLAFFFTRAQLDVFSTLSTMARANPPFRPSATAAAFFPSSVMPSAISPVAIRMTWTALEITSAGRFWPLGPLGICLSLSIAPMLELYRVSEMVAAPVLPS